MTIGDIVDSLVASHAVQATLALLATAMVGSLMVWEFPAGYKIMVLLAPILVWRLGIIFGRRQVLKTARKQAEQ